MDMEIKGVTSATMNEKIQNVSRSRINLWKQDPMWKYVSSILK